MERARADAPPNDKVEFWDCEFEYGTIVGQGAAACVDSSDETATHYRFFNCLFDPNLNADWMLLKHDSASGFVPEFIFDASRIVTHLRMVKSAKECDQIRRAGRIVKKAFDFIGSAAFDGINEQLLDAMARREARLEGAGDFRMLIGMGNGKGSLRPAEKRKIEPGTTITRTFGATLRPTAGFAGVFFASSADSSATGFLAVT